MSLSRQYVVIDECSTVTEDEVQVPEQRAGSVTSKMKQQGMDRLREMKQQGMERQWEGWEDSILYMWLSVMISVSLESL